MDNHWSDFIQTTEELYTSREVRFHDGNKDLWLKNIGVKPRMKVLEIGCGAGLFCHRLKQYAPDISVTGLDFDKNHIAFARKKAEELGVDCQFAEGDIACLPFSDESFDLVFSHTVVEHVPPETFYREQWRVLKPGGRITVLSVRSRLNIKDISMNAFGKEEERLQQKLWSQTEDVIDKYRVGIYERDEHEYPGEMERYGFRDVEVSVFTIMDYAPDNFNVPKVEAVRQINSHRIASLASIQKGFRLAPEALTEAEKNRLTELVHERYDKRLLEYEKGEKRWDFSTSTVMAVGGTK